MINLAPTGEEAAAATLSLPWDDNEWSLVRVDKVVWEQPWYVLRLKELENERLIRVLVSADPGDLAGVPASLSPWSAEAFAVLSYLDDYGEPHELTVRRYADFCLSDPNDFDRRKD